MPNFYQTLSIWLFFIVALLFSTPIVAQQAFNIEDIDGSTIRACEGSFFDSGGLNGDYGNRENFSATFCSDENNSGKSARITFRELDLRNNDILTFYDGPTANASLLQEVDYRSNEIVPFSVSATRQNESGCITVEFTSNLVRRGEGWNADVSCIDRCQVIQVELMSSDPPVMPVDTGWIDACIGQEISFEGRGIFPQEGLFYSHENSATYFWDFGDGSQRKEGRSVTHSYENAGGYIVQLTIIDQVGCISINNIDQRVRISPKPQFVVMDTPQFCAGDTLNLTGSINGSNSDALVSVNSVETTFQPRYTRSDSLFLPDGKGVAYETSLNISEFSGGQVLENINDLLGICINIEHSYMRDLQVSIECPNGTEVIMQNFENKNRVGSVLLGEPIDIESDLAPGVGYDYCWTPNASNGTWIEYDLENNIRTLPEGDYSSFSSLDSLVGCPLNGAWTITIEDYLLQDNGYIFDWSIAFDPDLYPALETFEAGLTNFSWTEQSSSQAILSSAGQNPYTFSVEDEFGCVFDTTIVVNALPPTHPDCYTCQPLLAQTEDLIYCEEDLQSLEVGANNLDQVIQFDAFPNFKTLNGIDHPNNAPYESSLEINSIFPNALDLSNLISVCIDIESANNNSLSDLSIWLEAPNGSRIELVSNNGGNGMAYTQTCFSPSATATIQSANAPFTGTFMAAGDWNTFEGIDINGSWKLLVADRNGTPNSTVKSWSLSFNSLNDITYAWTPNSGLSCSDCPNPDLIPTNSITNNYIVQANDQYNCMNTDTISVTNISNIEAPAINCETTDSRALAITWDEQTAVDYEISINGSDWFSPDTNQEHAINGLRNDDAVNIMLRPILEGIPIICQIPVNDTVCIYDGCELELMLVDAALNLSCADSKDGMVELAWQDGIAPFDYQFNALSSTTENATYRIDTLAAGDYEFIINDAEECSDTVTFVINAPPALDLTALVENPKCNDEQNGLIELEASGGTPDYSYSLDGIIFDKNEVFSGLGAGIYDLIVKDRNDCELQEQIELINPEAVVATIKRDDKEDFIQMTYGDGRQLFVAVSNAQGNVDYTWLAMNGDSISCTTCPSPYIEPNTTSYYEVEIIDENACKSTDRVQVRVERIFKYYVPTAFSPNEDGENERLTVYSEWSTKINVFQVYDRWGKLIFSASNFAPNDEMAGWDGYDQNGELMPTGNYTWYTEIEFNDGTKKLFMGSTTLLK